MYYYYFSTQGRTLPEGYTTPPWYVPDVTESYNREDDYEDDADEPTEISSEEEVHDNQEEGKNRARREVPEKLFSFPDHLADEWIEYLGDEDEEDYVHREVNREKRDVSVRSDLSIRKELFAFIDSQYPDISDADLYADDTEDKNEDSENVEETEDREKFWWQGIRETRSRGKRDVDSDHDNSNHGSLNEVEKDLWEAFWNTFYGSDPEEESAKVC